MSKPKMLSDHIADATLWQWRGRELDEAAAASVQQHLQSCRSCQQRAEALARLIGALQAAHHSIQPTFAEQMRLRRALESEFAPSENLDALVNLSRHLVRWLAPALAVLTVLFVLLRHETASTPDVMTALLSEMPEWQLIVASNDEQLQQAMLEFGLSNEGSIK